MKLKVIRKYKLQWLENQKFAHYSSYKNIALGVFFTEIPTSHTIWKREDLTFFESYEAVGELTKPFVRIFGALSF